MKSKACSLFTVAGVLAVSQLIPAMAATLTANCKKGDNLQTQINLANPGDTIEVSGTCRGRFTINKALTLEGHATLDGEKLGSVLTLDIGQPDIVTINNLTIVNGDTGTNFGGGGINADSLSKPFGTLVLNSVTMRNNKATCGGAISTLDSTVMINNSLITRNTAQGGGAICNEHGLVTINNSSIVKNNATDGGGISSFLGTVQLNHTSVSKNTVPELNGVCNSLVPFCSPVDGVARTGLGGGIFTISGNLSIASDSSIDHNVVSGGGGGVVVNDTNVTVTDSSVRHNLASVGGGIMSVMYIRGSLRLTRDEVSNNIATGPSTGPFLTAFGLASGGGGGILNSGPLAATGCTIAANFAPFLHGGGIDNFGPNVDNFSLSPILADSFVQKNVAADGGGIFNEPGSVPLTIDNTVISRNIPNQVAP